jgi:alpha-glucosidase
MKSQFVKAGAIIPKYPIQQYVGELAFEELTLDVYYKEGKEKISSMKMVKMDMITRKGDIAFVISSDWKKKVIIQLHKEGKFNTPYSKYKINFIDYHLKSRQ